MWRFCSTFTSPDLDENEILTSHFFSLADNDTHALLFALYLAFIFKSIYFTILLRSVATFQIDFSTQLKVMAQHRDQVDGLLKRVFQQAPQILHHIFALDGKSNRIHSVNSTTIRLTYDKAQTQPWHHWTLWRLKLPTWSRWLPFSSIKPAKKLVSQLVTTNHSARYQLIIALETLRRSQRPSIPPHANSLLFRFNCIDHDNLQSRRFWRCVLCHMC